MLSSTFKNGLCFEFVFWEGSLVGLCWGFFWDFFGLLFVKDLKQIWEVLLWKMYKWGPTLYSQCFGLMIDNIIC